MLRLTYISTAKPGIDQAGIDAVLAASRRNNRSDDVTGLLLYDGYRFLQALEGPAEAVNRAYVRIKADPRHRALVMLGSHEGDERLFGDWAMAAQRVSVAGGETVVELVDRLTATVADANMRELFRSFARVRVAA